MSIVNNVNICIHQVDMPRWDVINFGEEARTIHLRCKSESCFVYIFLYALSYHGGQHYASVRPINQPTGIPDKIVIGKPDLELVAALKQSKLTGPELITEHEKFVMDCTR